MILCDKCKLKEAVIHRIVITNGKKHAQHFCKDCAAQSGVIMFKLPSFAELAGAENVADSPMKKCVCSHTFRDFRKTGVLGCSECYKTFENELMPVISSAQLGRTQHQNRNSSLDGSGDYAENVDGLQKLLDEAVAAENYEEAAVLRDKIRALKAETPNNTQEENK